MLNISPETQEGYVCQPSVVEKLSMVVQVNQVKNNIQLASNTQSVYVTKLTKAQKSSSKALVKASSVSSSVLKKIDGISKCLVPQEWQTLCKKLPPAQLDFVMRARGIMITDFLKTALKDVSDWQNYPVTNRAIIVAYLAYTENFGRTISAEEKTIMNQIMASIQPREKTVFIQVILRLSQDSKSHLSNIGLSLSDKHVKELFRYAPTSILVRKFLNAGINTRLVQGFLDDMDFKPYPVRTRGIIAAYLMYIGGLAFDTISSDEKALFERLMVSVSAAEMAEFVEELFQPIADEYLHISTLGKVINNKQMLLFFRHVKDRSVLSLLLNEE